MLYTTLKVKDSEYKARLDAKALVRLEQRLGKNPLNIFMTISDDELPKISDVFVILHESLQTYQHDITMDDIYGIYDNYTEDGGDLITLINFIVSVFRESGFMPKEKKKAPKERKN